MTLSFEEAQGQAITDSTCFCMCGCRDFAVPGSILGWPVPGACDKCKKHERIATAAMYDFVTNPYVEEEEVALTPAVLRTKRADERAAIAAHNRLTREHDRVGKGRDLTNLRIPETVSDGIYAVRSDTGDIVRVTVERPTVGELARYVVVKFEVEDGTIVHYGYQKPCLFRWLEHYKGWYPQLLVKVIERPYDARALYSQIVSVAA